ncbi:pyridoxal phosphate-dependent aminotransferase [Tsuneonella sp. HG249]
MPHPAAAVAAMPASGIRTITNLALAMPDAIRLEIGEPNFATPSHIVEAAHRAARDGFTRYTHTQGLLPLREAWCERLARVNGCVTSPDRTIVTAGAVAGLHAAFAAVLAPGDEILIPDPGWPNWGMIAALIGARTVGYPCLASRGWQPDLDQLQALVTPRTRAILVNSPGNPTGAVLGLAALEAVAAFAERHDLWLISDECYDAIVFDGEHLSTAAVASAERTITIVSCSKTYAMTGWRMGCVAAPERLIPAIAKVQQATQASVCAVAQKAAEAALTGPQDCVAVMRAFYRARRDQAVGLLAALGRPIASPKGAFYAMVDLSDAVQDDTAFAHDLLTTHGVAVAPGSAFGPAGSGSVRIALCVGPDALASGLPLVVEAANSAAQAPSPGRNGQ